MGGMLERLNSHEKRTAGCTSRPQGKIALEVFEWSIDLLAVLTGSLSCGSNDSTFYNIHFMWSFDGEYMQKEIWQVGKLDHTLCYCAHIVIWYVGA